MSSYAITGASRGIGWELLSQLSSNPDNTVIALVRNKPHTEKRIADDHPDRTNIHAVYTDLDEYSSLESAAAETAKITGGGLDHLIANAAYQTFYDIADTLSTLGKDPQTLESELLHSFKTNTIANIHLFNLFTPLILRGTAKKVIAISSGQADAELVANLPFATSGSYAISKMALNMAVAKFSAEYAEQGVLFLSVCPGVVDTRHFDMETLTEEQMTNVAALFQKFVQYQPTFKGPRQPVDSVRDVLQVIHNATVETHAGKFISHKGNKQWI